MYLDQIKRVYDSARGSLQVETIGDAYMVVSGAPMVTIYHALYVSDMALDMLDAMTDLIEPSSGKHMRIRVG